MYEIFYAHTFLVFWDLSLIVELLGHKVTLYLTFRGTPKLSSAGTDHFTCEPAVREGSDFSASLLTTLETVPSVLQPRWGVCSGPRRGFDLHCPGD